MGLFTRKQNTVVIAPDNPAHIIEEQKILNELVHCATVKLYPQVASALYEFPTYGAKFEAKDYDDSQSWLHTYADCVSNRNFVIFTDGIKKNVPKLFQALGLIVQDITGRDNLTTSMRANLREASEQLLINLAFKNAPDTSHIKYEAFPHTETWVAKSGMKEWSVSHGNGGSRFSAKHRHGGVQIFDSLEDLAIHLFVRSSYHANQSEEVHTPHLREFLRDSLQARLDSVKGGKSTNIKPSATTIEQITAERDQLLIERDELLSERDDLLNELDSYRKAS